MAISEQIAFAAIFYFEQVFAFCKIIRKNRVGMAYTNNEQRSDYD